MIFLLKFLDFHSSPGEFCSFCASHSQFGSSREKNFIFLPRWAKLTVLSTKTKNSPGSLWKSRNFSRKIMEKAIHNEEKLLKIFFPEEEHIIPLKTLKKRPFCQDHTQQQLLKNYFPVFLLIFFIILNISSRQWKSNLKKSSFLHLRQGKNCSWYFWLKLMILWTNSGPNGPSLVQRIIRFRQNKSLTVFWRA